jgi:IS30 family transposase
VGNLLFVTLVTEQQVQYDHLEDDSMYLLGHEQSVDRSLRVIAEHLGQSYSTLESQLRIHEMELAIIEVL